MNTGQLMLDVRIRPPDDFADLDVRGAERSVAEELLRETAAAGRPKACCCRRPLSNGDGGCIWCGKATA